MSNLKLISVCGNHRSGTTLMNSLLDGHPKILAIPEETHFFTNLSRRRQISNSEDRFQWLIGRQVNSTTGAKVAINSAEKTDVTFEPYDFWTFIEENSSDASLERQLLLEAVEQDDGSHSFQVLVSRYLNALGENPKDLEWVSEKTPLNEFLWKEISKLFPDVQFVHMVRDPFEVAASMTRKMDPGAKKETKLINVGLRWRNSLIAGQRIQEALPGQHRFLRLESLRETPQQTMQSLSESLGIEYCDSLNLPTRFSGKEPWTANTIRGKAAVGKIDQNLQQSQATEILNTAELNLIGELVGDWYSLAGYDTHASHCKPQFPSRWDAIKFRKVLGPKGTLAMLLQPTPNFAELGTLL